MTKNGGMPMEQMLRDHINASIEALHLPAYQEIPDVGLYLEQTAKYISDALAPIQDTPITGSMSGSRKGCPSAAAASRQMPMMLWQSARFGVSSISKMMSSMPIAV